MDINHLIYFKKVAELQNMTKAAEELIITQPALSRVIRNLEDELGYKLFERNGKNIVLNQNGQIFLKSINEIIDIIDRAKHEIREINNQNMQTVKVVMRTGVSILPYLLKKFKEIHPEIKVEIYRNSKEEQMQQEIDCMIDVSLSQENNDHDITLMKEDSRLLIAKQLLAEYTKKDSLYDFRNETFFVLRNSIQNEITIKACQNAGFTPKISMDFASSETIHSFLESGLGVAIVPSKTWNYVTHPGLILLDIPVNSDIRYINMKCRETNNQNLIAFREFCIRFFEEFSENADFNLLFESR